MNMDLRTVPFSSYGSWLVISCFQGRKNIADGLYLRSVHGGDNHISRLFKIDIIKNGEPIPFETNAEPGLLTLKAEKGYVELCICEENLLRFEGLGVGLRLTMEGGYYDNAIPYSEGRYEINSYSEEIKFMASPINGQLKIDAPWDRYRSQYIMLDFSAEDSNKTFQGAMEAFTVVWEKREYNETFKSCVDRVKDDYNKWLNSSLQVPEYLKEGKELAGYITWSSIVNSKGKLTRPAMYMSKNWMTNIWSWDHCFNAMALAKNNPELAFHQLMIFIDNQDASGAFPDFINDKFASWSCSKPPIHGWAVNWMLERTDYFTKDHIEKLYEPLCRWTEWWFKYRDYDNDGIPQYNHGNDCGWDNSTVFNNDMPPVESPDLMAFLIIQMEVLSKLAEKLGKEEDKIKWEKRWKEALNNLLNHSVKDGAFCAPISGSHKIYSSESLLLYVPLVLGDKLPKNILQNLINGLKEEGRFITDFGLATESVKSEYYTADGYWRGPIWAPSTMIMVDALSRVGERELAKEIANKFCRMANKSGMAENFDALTGEGLRDRAFTWTSSVFLILGNEYAEDAESEER